MARPSRATAAAVALALWLSLVTVWPAAARPAPARDQFVEYRPPVEAPLTDRFRPPASRFGPGNRGVDYATAPGTPVRSAAPGEVTFAGPVGGALHVVVLHADGILTSYSFLAGVAVGGGQRVAAGQVVGLAGPSLHFGARIGDAYIDPLSLLAGRRGRRVRDHDPPAAERAFVPDEGPARPPPVSSRSLEWARAGPQASPS